MGQHRCVTTGLIYKNTEGVGCGGTAGAGDSCPPRVSDYLSHTARARVAKSRVVNPLQRLRCIQRFGTEYRPAKTKACQSRKVSLALPFVAPPASHDALRAINRIERAGRNFLAEKGLNRQRRANRRAP
jgi:hypothetical protein